MVKHRCPCCGYITLETRGNYEICPVCFWEDDGDATDASPANHGLIVAEGRQNYKAFGACERNMILCVRPPRPEEE